MDVRGGGPGGAARRLLGGRLLGRVGAIARAWKLSDTAAVVERLEPEGKFVVDP